MAASKEVVQGFAAHLKKKGLRFTDERLKLLELILGMRGHFSPDDVLAKVHAKKLPVSRATIYRLLPVLVDADLIKQSLLSAEGQTQFEVTWKRAHHDHLICSRCQRIIEFQHNTIEILQREIANKYGFVLENHVMELVGRCRDCQSSG